MPTLTTGPVELHYEDTGGDGRPVVLIHGWPLSGKSWAGTVPTLTAAGHRVITYDRRGFGDSAKLGADVDYGYTTLAKDLAALLTELDLHDVSLVGFSMGGGEIARYIGDHGEDRLHSVVFASAVPPYLLKSDDHPGGALTLEDVAGMQGQLREDPHGFFDEFCTGFYSAGDDLKVSEEQRQAALALADQADPEAAARCIASWVEDFRDDVAKVTVPTLVIHGDSDGTVPFEVSGKKTHELIATSELHVVEGGPHGINDSHTEEFNAAVVAFLAK